MATKIFSKRTLAMLLALVMCFSSLQLSVFAVEATEPALVENFPDTYYNQDGTVGSADDWSIHLSKTAAPTAQDNVYNITLTVETKDVVTQLTGATHGAVALVLDASSSMDEDATGVCQECGKAKSDKDHNGKNRTHDYVMLTHLDLLKSAVVGFLRSYAANAAEGDKRLVSIVKFAKDASTVQGWVDVANSTNLDTVINQVYGIGWSSGTNIEAGLALGRNLLNMSDVNVVPLENQSLILFSDGEPSYAVADADSTSTSEIVSSGSWAFGTTATDDISRILAGVSAKKKAVAYNTDASLLISEFGAANVISSSASSLLPDLMAEADKIITSKTNASTVTDPMGTGVSMVSVSSNYNDQQWDLSTMEPTVVDGVTTYTITYQVEIDPTAVAADANYPAYTVLTPANGATTLNYTFGDDNTPVTADFNEPNIRGIRSFAVRYAYTGEIPEGAPAVPATQTYKAGASVQVAGEPSLDHYTFSGWSENDFTMPAEDVTITGSWTEHPKYDFSVIYNANFGDNETKVDEENITDTYNTSHTIRVNDNTFVRPNYTFLGWNTQADGKGTSYKFGDLIALNTENKTVTLFAQWQENPKYDYSVTYNEGYGLFPATQKDAQNATQIYDETYTITVDVNTFDRANHNFVGWATEKNGAVVYNAGDEITFEKGGSAELFAVWQEHDKYSYTVIYNGNGGALEDSSLSYGDEENKVDTYASSHQIKVDKNTFSFEHHDFIGWNTKADGSGVAYTAENVLALTASAENKSITITLYAQWKEHEKFDYEVVYTDDSNEDAIPQTDIQSRWQTYTNPYTIEVDENDYFTRENYTFIGWAIVEEVEAVAEDAEIVVDYRPGDEIIFNESGRVVLRAVWEENPKYDYALTYVGNGGELIGGLTTIEDEENVEEVYDTAYGIGVNANKFSRENYDFIGWNTKADGTGTAYNPGNTVSLVCENPTAILYAQWKEHPKHDYTVIYNANFGDNETKFDEENVVSVYDTEYAIHTDVNDFVRENYTFIGWNTEADGSGESYEFGAPIALTAEENAAILYAQWQENPKYDYTVTYNAGYGLVPATKDDAQNAIQTYLETYAITVDENTFVRDHYDFIGWSTEKDGEVEFLANDMITFTEGGSEELFAVWAEHDKYAYTVIYNGNGGALEDAAVSYGDEENVVDTYATEHTASVDANTFVREHYDFIGWNTKADGTGDAYTAEQALALTAENNSITLYAQWEEHEKFDYEVIYHPNTEDPIESIPDSENVKDSYETEKEFTVDENTFVNENEEFIGWSTEPDGEVVYKPGDVIEFTEGGKVDLYAQWEPMDREYTVVYYVQIDNNPYAPFEGEVPAGGVLPHGTVVGMEIVNPPASITDGTYTYEFVRLDEIVLGAGENVVNVFFRYETPAPVVPETEEPATEPEEPTTEPAQPATVDDDGLVELPDEDVPLASAPNTGDPMLIYAGMTLLSGAGLAYLGLGKKKEEEEE